MPNFVIAANIYMIWHLSICNSAPRELELRKISVVVFLVGPNEQMLMKIVL
jgi:hypothetical protein